MFQTKVSCPMTFFKKLRDVWDNVEKYCRTGQTTWQYGAWAFHTGCLTLQTHSEYVIPIAFPLQQWLHKRGSKNAHCLSCYLWAWWFRMTETHSLLIVHKYTDVLDGDLTDYLLICLLKFNNNVLHCYIFPQLWSSVSINKKKISVPQSLNGTMFIPSVMKIRQMGQNFTQAGKHACTHRGYSGA
jgi:hypothetical protein